MSITGVNNIQTVLPVSKIPYLKNINALNNISEEQRQEFRQKTIKTALIECVKYFAIRRCAYVIQNGKTIKRRTKIICMDK